MGLSKRSVIIIWIGFYLAIALLLWFQTPQILRQNINTLVILSFLQKLTGMFAFIMIVDQIVIGAYLPKITEKLGGWFYNFHIIQGIIAYSLIVLHPLIYLAFLTIAKNSFDPFYIFIDICISCQTKSELYISLGRIALYLVTIAVIIARFRVIPALRKYWRIGHTINYPVFYLVAIHAKKIGSNMGTGLFFAIFVICVSLVSIVLLLRIKHFFKDFLKLRLR